MSFQLSPELDKNKVFLVSRSELEGRLDPVFYYPKYMANEEGIRNSKWGFKKVGHIAKRIADGPFGSDLKVDEYQSHGNPLLRVSNIRTGEIEGELVYISDEKQKQLKRSKVYPNDVLLTKAGAILGYSAVFPESLGEGNVTSHLVTITCRSGIDPHYLSHFFRSNIGQLQIYRWGNKSTRPELNTGEVKNILVTTPPSSIQQKIVENLNAAYAAKKQKEAEAQRLLDSIDEYLLGELGIELPEQEENTLQSRMFTRRLSEVSGGRFDPKLYDNKTKATKDAISNTSYPTEKLKKLLIHSVAGDWGKDIDEESGSDYQKCLVIRATEFDNLYNLKLDNSRVKYRFIPTNKIRKVDIQKNDLLIEKSGGSPDQPVGRIAILRKEILEDKNIFCSNFIHKFRVSSQLHSEYLFCFLKTVHNVKLTDAMQSQTNGIRNLIMRDYFNQIIPIPPVEKQTEIANHITNIRSKAKALQQQAKADLEQAKKEVEAMILGEDENMA